MDDRSRCGQYAKKRSMPGQYLYKERPKGGQFVDKKTGQSEIHVWIKRGQRVVNVWIYLDSNQPLISLTSYLQFIVYHQCGHSLNLDKDRSKSDQCLDKERSKGGQ